MKFTHVKRHKTPVGKSCLHCRRPATVTATRKTGGFKMDVAYCDEHAEMRGAISVG